MVCRQRKYGVHSIGIHQFDWIPHTIVVGTYAGILVRHRVNAQPHGHQLMVHITGTEISVARFPVFLFPGER